MEINLKEGNVELAKFMGMIENSTPYDNSFLPPKDDSEFKIMVCRKMDVGAWYVYPEFHSSWDWLMAVVERIEDLGYSFEIVGNQVEIRYVKETDLRKFSTTVNVVDAYGFKNKSLTKLEAVWLACTEFSNWYNEIGKNISNESENKKSTLDVIWNKTLENFKTVEGIKWK